MPDVVFSPTRELVVHECLDVNMDDLLRERITPAGTIPLYWCDGILFSFSSMPMTKDVAKDYLNGTIHWAEVHYAQLDAYDPVLELNDEHLNGKVKIRVINTSRSTLHKDFVKWLKETRIGAGKQIDR
jgi:hypothetical protein